jgi:hypothetical protein
MFSTPTLPMNRPPANTDSPALISRPCAQTGMTTAPASATPRRPTSSTGPAGRTVRHSAGAGQAAPVLCAAMCLLCVTAANDRSLQPAAGTVARTRSPVCGRGRLCARLPDSPPCPVTSRPFLGPPAAVSCGPTPFCIAAPLPLTMNPSLPPPCVAAPALWVDTRGTPAWVASELARLDASRSG